MPTAKFRVSVFMPSRVFLWLTLLGPPDAMSTVTPSKNFSKLLVKRPASFCAVARKAS